MSLDTMKNIEDKPGVAIYVVHDGSPRSQDEMKNYGLEILQHTDKQLLLIDGSSVDGRDILEFYTIKALPAVLLVRDDDELHHSWAGTDLPQAAQVAYIAEQVG